MMGVPARRTMLLFDIEDSQRHHDAGQQAIRQTLYEVVGALLEQSGADEAECRTEYRGDGLFVLVDPAVRLPALLRQLLITLPEELAHRRQNHGHGAPVRLRTVLHRGTVVEDENDVVGSALNSAFRLLDSDPLRSSLRGAGPGTDFVLCVSETVYDDAVWPGHKGIDREAFGQVVVPAKNGSRVLTGWLYAPERRGQGSGPSEAAPDAGARPARTSPRTDPAAPGGAGVVNVKGAQVSGGHVDTLTNNFNG
ncbi:hypothetical protein [Streptomyces sp. NPDC053048]|uniref:hypothetical protein n=1 Tax=Streptomyces sp. NPDC053048 TaxID=3365694 RepID=UPI0037CE54D9